MQPTEKTQEQQMDEQYTAKDYKKSVFTFSALELRDIHSYETLVKMAQLMQADAVKLFNSVVNGCLKRSAVKESMAVQVLPDIVKGTIIVWEPKIWCSICNNAKAEYQYAGKYYCKTCINTVKQKEIKEVKKPEVKKEEEKKSKDQK